MLIDALRAHGPLRAALELLEALAVHTMAPGATLWHSVGQTNCAHAAQLLAIAICAVAPLNPVSDC